MRATRKWVNRGRGRRGAAAVEFAVILPVLTTLILGGVDFGRFAYTYIALTNAVQAGAWSAMMNNFTSSTQSTWSTNVTTATKDEMTSQTGYTAASMTVTVTTSTDANGLKRAQVKASYPFQTIINWNWQGNGKTITLERKVEARLIR
jgi:Flp pilus assembly protein TadG